MNSAPSAPPDVLGDALACTELRPARFEPAVLETGAMQANLHHAEQLMRQLLHIEESRPTEDGDDSNHADPALQRIEARLELLTLLVSRLLRHDRALPATELTWNAEGAVLVAGTDDAEEGWLHLQPADWLPEALVLPAKVECADAQGRLHLRFQAMPATLVGLLEQHLFRLHRRQVAEQRRAQQRGGDAGQPAPPTAAS